METRNKRILFGCLGGCGAIVVIFLGSCVGFTVWLNSPSEVLDPETLIGPETTGYVEWILRLEDPGTAEFTEALLRSFTAITQKSNSPLPDGLENIINAQQIKGVRKDMERLFPVVVAWTSQPGETQDADHHVFSLSARGAGHQLTMLDWIFGFLLGKGDNDVEIVRHRDEKIYLINTSDDVTPAAFIKKGIVFISTDIESARQTLDRLQVPPAESGAGVDLGVLYGALPKDHALRGALTNRRGEVQRMLDQLGLSTDTATEETWGEIEGLTVVANFRDEDVFAGAMEVHGPDTAWAETHAESLGTALASLFDQWDIEFETEVGHAGRRIRVDFTAADLLDSVENIN